MQTHTRGQAGLHFLVPTTRQGSSPLQGTSHEEG
jgi:hypothetical protein